MKKPSLLRIYQGRTAFKYLATCISAVVLTGAVKIDDKVTPQQFRFDFRISCDRIGPVETFFCRGGSFEPNSTTR